jgi:YD repeat-containing protein
MRFVILKRCLLILLVGLWLLISLLSASELKARDVTYFYDELSRLVRVIYDDGTIIEYTYDQVGNRLTKTISRESTIAPSAPSRPSGGDRNPVDTFSNQPSASRQ